MEQADQILAPPPTPHQLALTLICQSIFPSSRARPHVFPNRESVEAWYIQESHWLMRMLQMITRETMGVYKASTYKELCEEVDGLRRKYAVKKEGEVVNAPLLMLRRMLYVDGDEEVMGPNVIIQHTSPTAHFLRNIYIGYKILTFTQAYVLADGVLRFCGVSDPAGFRKQVANDERKVAAGLGGGVEWGDGAFRDAEGVVRTREGSVILGGLGSDAGDDEDEEVGRRLDHLLEDLLPGFEAEDKMDNGVVFTGSANRLTEIDDNIDVRVIAFRDYQKAQKQGDYSKSLASLMKFYDYRFPPNQGRQMMHHAMLNFAYFHYSTGGLEAAAAAAEETIIMARHFNDDKCLKQAFSLSRRLTSEMRPPMGSIQTQGLQPHTDDTGIDDKYATPLDELWSLKQRLDLGDTVPSAYNRMQRVIGRVEAVNRAIYEESVRVHLPPEHPEGNLAGQRDREDHQRRLKEQKEADEAQAPLRTLPQSGMVDAATLHATQSGIWDLPGCRAVTELHHDIATQCPRSGKDVDLTLTINKAERQTRRGNTMQALSRLLEPYIWENLCLTEYHKWAEAVWDVAETEATRREDHDAVRIISTSRIPTYAYRQLGPGGPIRNRDHYDEPYSQSFFDPEGHGMEVRAANRLSAQLVEARNREAQGSAPLQALEPLLSAVHVASKLGLWLTYRRAAAELADVFGRIDSRSDGMVGNATTARVDHSMLRLGELEVEPIWEQILATEDLEIIFSASWVLARAKRLLDPKASWRFAKTCFQSAVKLRSPSRTLKICALLVLMCRTDKEHERESALLAYWNQVEKGNLVIPVPDDVCDIIGDHDGYWQEGWNHNGEDPANVVDDQMVRDLREMITLVGVNIANTE